MDHIEVDGKSYISIEALSELLKEDETLKFTLKILRETSENHDFSRNYGLNQNYITYIKLKMRINAWESVFQR